MNKFWIICAGEYAQVVRKKSFFIGLVLTPLMMITMTMLPAFLATREVGGVSPYSIIDADGRGIGHKLAQAMERYTMPSDSTRQAYPLKEIYEVGREDTAGLSYRLQFLDSLVLAKELTRYIVIYPDAEQNDSVALVSKAFAIQATRRYEARISNILSAIRLEKAQITKDIDSVLSMTHRTEIMQNAPGGQSKNFQSIYFGALIFVMIVFIVVFGFGQILMRSIIEEKNSRIMEVMVSSVSPLQLMMGKLAGLGAAGLTQIGIWVLLGGILFFGRGYGLNIPDQVTAVVFNPVIIFFFLTYLVVAYVIYAAMFVLVGSLCGTDKESQNFVFPIVMSLMLPVFALVYFVQQPDSVVSVVFSFIPLFTPTMMIARLNIIGPTTFSFANPIVLEAAIGLITSALFGIGLIWLAARIFRMGILMYGKRATLPEIIKWVRHR